jgi:hypothetical protein
VYFVDCNATVPAFFVRIQNTEFTIDPKDNIIQAGEGDDGKQRCMLGSTNGGEVDEENIFIL